MRCNHHEATGRACSCADTYQAIVAGENIPRLEGFCAIVREAAKYPAMLRAFASDLITHDRAELTGYAGPFLWVLRENGTQLVKPDYGTWECHPVQSLVQAFGWEGTRWYWFDGKALHELSTAEQAREKLDHARASVLACRQAEREGAS